MSRDAVIVGINTYQYLPNLKAPAVDAEAIAQRLQTYGEFRIHRLPEIIQDNRPQIGVKTAVTLRELEAALVRLFKPPGDHIPQTALFYFSGHGLQKQAGIREGYLAVSDANPEQSFYGLSLFWLRRLLQESPVRQRIILLDCCHSGELLNFLDADPGAKAGTDRLFMAASREYESAYESLTGKYSVFTDALVSGLDPRGVPSRIVTNHSLTNWVSQKLKGELQQPLFESSGSEMILTRTSEPATAPVFPPPPPPPPRHIPMARQGMKGNVKPSQKLQKKIPLDFSQPATPNVPNGEVVEESYTTLKYLLPNKQLIKAKKRLIAYSQDSLTLAQQYMGVSEQQRFQTQKDSKVLQTAIPAALVVALAITLNQYRAASVSEVSSGVFTPKTVQSSPFLQRVQKNFSAFSESHPSIPLAFLSSSPIAGQLPIFSLAERSMASAVFLPNRPLPTLIALERQQATDRLWWVEWADPAQIRQVPLSLLGHSERLDSMTGLTVSPDGLQIAIASSIGQVSIWNLPTEVENSNKPLALEFSHTLQTPNAKGSAIRHLSFRPDGQQLLGVGDNLQVYLWQVDSGKHLHSLQGHQSSITKAQFSPDGEQIITASWDRTARLWQATSGNAIAILPHEAALSGASFSPDSRLVMTATWDKTAKVWDAKTRNLQGIFAGHTAPVLGAEFSPDGQWLLTASADGTVRSWETHTGTQKQVFQTLNRQSVTLEQVFFTSDMQYIGALSQEGHLSVWKADAQLR